MFVSWRKRLLGLYPYWSVNWIYINIYFFKAWILWKAFYIWTEVGIYSPFDKCVGITLASFLIHNTVAIVCGSTFLAQYFCLQLSCAYWVSADKVSGPLHLHMVIQILSPCMTDMCVYTDCNPILGSLWKTSADFEPGTSTSQAECTTNCTISLPKLATMIKHS